jgi:hypothetical protein
MLLQRFLAQVKRGKRSVDGLISDFESHLKRWTGVDGVISIAEAARPGSAGTHCLRLSGAGGMPWPCAWAFATRVRPGCFYLLDGWCVKRTNNGSVSLEVRGSGVDQPTYYAPWIGAWTVDAWKRQRETFQAPPYGLVDLHFSGPVGADGQYMDMDDVSLTRLAWADIIGDLTVASDSVTIGVRITNPVDTGALGVRGQGGVICNLDDASSPQNCVLAHMHWADDGSTSRVLLKKCVNGVWSTLVSGAVTYVTGAFLQLARSGNDYSVWYNGALVGTVTVEDVSIIGNTLHGSFNPAALAGLSGFSCVDGAGAVIFEARIANAADDGRWFEGNSSFGTGGALRFGYDDAAAQRANSFLRFAGVSIPVGATVQAAYVTITASDPDNKNTVNLKVNAVKALSPAAPVSYAGAEGAPRTTAVVAWAGVPAWSVNSPYDSPDLAAVIQELIDQAGWAAGNAMVIYIEDDGSSAVAYTERSGISFDADPAKAARLHVEFTP